MINNLCLVNNLAQGSYIKKLLEKANAEDLDYNPVVARLKDEVHSDDESKPEPPKKSNNMDSDSRKKPKKLKKSNGSKKERSSIFVEGEAELSGSGFQI